jgi:hypothetical protein
VIYTNYFWYSLLSYSLDRALATRNCPTRITPDLSTVKPVSKSSVLVNLVQTLLAIVLGNFAYFLLSPSLPLPRHSPFQLDVGLVVDFFFCVVAYGLIRTARRWK